MNTESVIAHFGSVAELASALGITVQAIYQWGETVPPLRQYQIKELRPDLRKPSKSKVAA